MRLESAGLTTLELDRDSGLIVEEFDLGFPEVRESANLRPDMDGTDDRTMWHGARAVTLRIALGPSGDDGIQTVADRLRAFCRPRLRPFLYFEQEGAERRIRLRADQLSAPLTNQSIAQVQVSWRAPDGIIEAADETIDTVAASADVEAGISFPISFPLVFPASDPVGTQIVTNDGNTDAWPILRLYGPCEDPRIENHTAEKALIFDGLTIAAGDYVELDTLERSVTLNSDPDQNRYHLLDFASSAWWPLEPGQNLVRYYPVTFSSPATAEVRFRSAWI